MRGGHNKKLVDRQLLSYLYGEGGLSAYEIAPMLGISTPVVYRHLREMGISRRRAVPNQKKPAGNFKGKRKDSTGYVIVFIERSSPYFTMTSTATRSRRGGHVREHRLVMAQHLERCLQPYEVVHHRNRNKTDNRLENLELFQSQAEHNSVTQAHREIDRLMAIISSCPRCLLAAKKAIEEEAGKNDVRDTK